MMNSRIALLDSIQEFDNILMFPAVYLSLHNIFLSLRKREAFKNSWPCL